MRYVLAAIIVLSISVAAVADWPQFLGPDRNGISPDTTKLAKHWPEAGPKELWKIKVGAGFGGPAIVGNEVYLLDRQGDKEIVRCLSLADGKELWHFDYDAPGKIDHAGSRSTPAVDDKFVFTIGAFGDFYCLDRKTHKVVWQKNILKDFGAQKPNWAVATSPLLYKDMVVIVPAGKEAGIVALKKDSGQVVWKSESCGSEQYMSAVLMKIDGVEQILGYGNGGGGGGGKSKEKGKADKGEKKGPTTGVLSVDAETGKTLWRFDKWGCSIPIATPVNVGDGKIFLSGGYNAGSVMFEAKKAGAEWETKELWRLDAQECGSQIQQALLYKGYLYVDNNENGKVNGMTCVSVDGKVAWKSDKPPCEKGGQVLADGMIYKVDGKRGMLFLVDPDPKGFKVVSQVQALDKGEDWAPVVISDGHLIIRDQGQMKCYDVK